MKGRSQVSTDVGVLTLMGGVLNIFQDVQLTDCMSVFQNLTFGQAFNMLFPLAVGLWSIFHNEAKNGL